MTEQHGIVIEVRLLRFLNYEQARLADREQPQPARPAGRGGGLDGPPCPERDQFDQGYHATSPGQAMCVRCGRVTYRRDHDGMHWCGGTAPDDE